MMIQALYLNLYLGHIKGLPEGRPVYISAKVELSAGHNRFMNSIHVA